jgi:hypothetical protein
MAGIANSSQWSGYNYILSSQWQFFFFFTTFTVRAKPEMLLHRSTNVSLNMGGVSPWEFSLRMRGSSRIALHKFDIAERGAAATHSSSDVSHEYVDASKSETHLMSTIPSMQVP